MTVTINDWSTTAGNNGSTLGTVAEGAWPENTMQSADINNAAREMMAVVARWYGDNNGTLTTAGTQPVYTVAAPNQSTLAAYYDGFTVMVDFHATNSSATVPPTLNVNSLGAKDLIWPDGTDLAQNDITAGMKASLVYDGTKFQVLSLNGAPGAVDPELTAIAGLTSAADKVIRYTGSGTADLLDFNDEDDMASDSATAVASQQSIKAYADGVIAISQQEVTTTSSNAETTPAFNNNIPQNTDGTQYLTVSHTPADTANILDIEAVVHVSNSAGTFTPVSLFQDATANALATACEGGATADDMHTITLRHRMVAGTVSSTTFNIRVGAASGTNTINGRSGSQVYGGTLKSWIRVIETKP